MSPSRALVAGAAAVAIAATTLIVPGATPGGAMATRPASVTPGPDQAATASAALDWLRGTQEDDGGFELADFPGFETPDAILALASGGQSDETWDTAEALAAVEAVTIDGGADPLDAIDDLIDGGIDAQQAAKVIFLVAAPLGLDASDLDPSEDSDDPVDVAQTLADAAGQDGSYSGIGFSGRLFVPLALAALGEPVPAALTGDIRDAQQANGGWNFSGDPSGTDFTADTTGYATLALAAAGVGPDDPALTLARQAFAESRRPSGAWASFGKDDPNATALAILGLAAAGADVAEGCWRDTARPELAGTDYTDPRDWLASRQQPNGRIASPNDSFGINTLATTQSVQALYSRWYPEASGDIACPDVGANRRFVQAVYPDTVGRPADPDGATFFTAALDEGTRRSQVARWLLSSIEGHLDRLDGWYRDLLGRPLDGAGRQAFLSRLAAGDHDRVLASILGSAEYRAINGGTDTGAVNTLYDDVLRRPADDAGRDRYLALIDDGWSRAQVARAMITSAEGRGALAAQTYLRLLDRPIDRGGRQFWIAGLRGGTPVITFEASLLGSAEYVAGTR